MIVPGHSTSDRYDWAMREVSNAWMEVSIRPAPRPPSGACRDPRQAPLRALCFARDRDTRWLLNEAVPRIEGYLAVADWESACGLAREAETRVPDSREVAELWPRISWRVTITSEPAGATVFRQAYNAAGDGWEDLGRTPLHDIRIPYGLSRLRFEREGYRPLVRAIGGAHINWSELSSSGLSSAVPDILLVAPETFQLDAEQTLPPDMVRVSGWSLTLGGEEIQLNDFFLGRHEVTNAEFGAFVDAGGYTEPGYWDPIVVNGDTLPRERGRELPTAHHWQQALANAMFPWLLPASNFTGERARQVTDSKAMSHGEGSGADRNAHDGRAGRRARASESRGLRSVQPRFRL